MYTLDVTPSNSPTRKIACHICEGGAGEGSYG